MKHLYFFILFFILSTGVVNAQCPGPSVRTALINLQKAGLVESTMAGQFGLTDDCGNQRYSQYTEIELVPVGFTPTPTGNTSNFSEFVTDPSGSVWYIDWQGRGILLFSATSCDQDFLEIDHYNCPDNIADSIFTKSYAAFGARYVWPSANLLVSDSVLSADVIISGNRDARLGLYNNLSGAWCGINQSGSEGNIYVGPTTSTFNFVENAGTNPSIPTGPFNTHMTIDFDNNLIRINKYPDTRVDTTAIVNFLSTDPNGYIRSHPITDISGGVFANQGVYLNGDTVQLGKDYFLSGLPNAITGERVVLSKNFFDNASAMVFNDENNGIAFRILCAPDSAEIDNALQGSVSELTSIDLQPNGFTIGSFDASGNGYVLGGPSSASLQQAIGSDISRVNLSGSFLNLISGSGANTNNVNLFPDSLQAEKRFSYTTDLSGTFTKYSHVDKNWVENQGYLNGVSVSGPLTGSGTSLFPLDILNESIDSSRLKNGGVSRKDITPAPGLSIMARDSNTTGYLKYLPLTANQVVTVNSAGTVLGGGAVNLASSAAVTGTLPTTNLNTTSTTNGVIVQQGNSLGNSMIIGTNDNNTVTIETNNAGKLTVGTGGTLATFSDAATTTSVVQAISNSQTTSGTAGNGFGLGQLYNVESSSGNLRAIGQTDWIWAIANDGTRTMRYAINGINSGATTPSEMWRMEAATAPVMKIAGAMGTPGSTTYANAGIAPAVTYTLGGTSSAINIGNGTGIVNIFSVSSASNAVKIATTSAASGGVTISTTSTNINAGIRFGESNVMNNTTGTRYVTNYTDGHTVASGSGGMFYANVSGTFNETGSTGMSGVFDLNPTLTAISGGFSFLNNSISNSDLFIINSTGTNTRSNHYGPFGFGAATTGADKVEVTGNVALMTAGDKLKIATGSNASIGTSVLVSGQLTVNTKAITASSKVFLSVEYVDGSPGFLSADPSNFVPGVSFLIQSWDSLGTLNTGDISSINWWIIN